MGFLLALIEKFLFFVAKKEEKYYIQETKQGTDILPFKVLNGTRAFLELKDTLEYAVLDSQLMDDEVFLEIVKLYALSRDNRITDLELIKKVETLIGNFEGLLFQKTIYKVKK